MSPAAFLSKDDLLWLWVVMVRQATVGRPPGPQGECLSGAVESLELLRLFVLIARLQLELSPSFEAQVFVRDLDQVAPILGDHLKQSILFALILAITLRRRSGKGMNIC